MVSSTVNFSFVESPIEPSPIVAADFETVTSSVRFIFSSVIIAVITFVSDAIGSLASEFFAYSNVSVVVSYDMALTAVISNGVCALALPTKLGCQNLPLLEFSETPDKSFGIGESIDEGDD